MADQTPPPLLKSLKTVAMFMTVIVIGVCIWAILWSIIIGVLE